jgi:D-3-phosphoglycerate dehydrogenase
VAELVFAHFFGLSRDVQRSNSAPGGHEFKKTQESYAGGQQLRGRLQLGISALAASVLKPLHRHRLGMNVLPSTW